ncbi:MAG: V4R domain-containing protein [Thermodesulfobacteriota bacterium]
MPSDGSNGYVFDWTHLGDIDLGRPNLGPNIGVGTYRLMRYTMRHVLTQRLGDEKAREMFVEAGRLAGAEFCKHSFEARLDFPEFVVRIQERLKAMHIGIFRVEKADPDALQFVFTVHEDLDCSGLPVLGQTVCEYDEGFIAGLLNFFYQREFRVKEIDCWAAGGRVCRFQAHVAEGE